MAMSRMMIMFMFMFSSIFETNCETRLGRDIRSRIWLSMSMDRESVVNNIGVHVGCWLRMAAILGLMRK